MSTQIILVADGRGFTVQLSTTHRTQAGALAHFTEMLAQLHHQHPATGAAGAATMASTAAIAPPAAAAEASDTVQLPVNPFTRSRLAYRNFDNGREEPPF